MVWFEPLPTPLDQHGQPRRVGIELEFAGVPVAAIAETVHRHFGGKTRTLSPFEQRVDSKVGTFKIEFDSRLFKGQPYLPFLESLGLDRQGQTLRAVERLLGSLAETIIPYELSTPPMTVDQLLPLDDLRADLMRQGARGTTASLRYGFGLHLNVSAARGDLAEARRVLQAYLRLEDKLMAFCSVDFTRAMLPYIKPFPDEYKRLLLSPGYTSDDEQFLADFLRFNHTRNRPLDLTPLLGTIDADRVKAALDPAEHHLFKPRPAFHFRLPDCRIDDIGWNLGVPWNLWVDVERASCGMSVAS